jgi:hypothetical protein
MAWDDIQESGTVIDYSEWNTMVTQIKQGGPSGAQISALLASGTAYSKAVLSGQGAVPLDQANANYYPSSLGQGVSGALYTHVNDGSMHGGTSTIVWNTLTASTGITPFANEVSISSQAAQTLTILGYAQISSNAVSGANFALSGVKYTQAYLSGQQALSMLQASSQYFPSSVGATLVSFSSQAIGMYYPSALGKLVSGAALWIDGSKAATGELSLPLGIQVTPTVDPGDSQSTGGAINVTMTSVDGSAIVVYTNKSSSDGHLVQIGSDNQNFNKSNLRVWSDSDANTVTVTHSNVSSNNETVTFTSASSGNTVLGITGKPATRGIIKVTHQGTVSDDTSSALSVDLAGAGTAAQGLYVDATGGGTTGKLIRLRNSTDDKFYVDPNGAVWAKSGISGTALSGNILRTSYISSDTWTATIAQIKNLTDGTNADSLHSHTLGGGSGGFPSGTTGSLQWRSGNAHCGTENLIWNQGEDRLVVSGSTQTISLSSQKISGGTGQFSSLTVNGVAVGSSTGRSPITYLIYENGGSYYCISGETGVEVSSNAFKINYLMSYVLEKAKNRTNPYSDIYLVDGDYYMSGEFFIPSYTTIRGAGHGTRFIGDWATNSEIVLSGSYIKLSDFDFFSSMRISIRQGLHTEGILNNVIYQDIVYDNIHAYNINTSGHRGTFENGYWGHMDSSGHNKSAFWAMVRGSGSIVRDVTHNNCSVISSSSFGFTLESANYSGSYNNIHYEECLAQGIGLLAAGTTGNAVNYSVGYSLNEATQLVSNVDYTNCTARNVWRSGFHIEAVPPVFNINYINCLSEDVGIIKDIRDDDDTKGYAKGFWSHSGCRFINCTSIRARDAGFYAVNGLIMSNCYIQGHSTDRYGIYGYGDAGTNGKVVIENTIIKDTNAIGVYLGNYSGAIINGCTFDNIGIGGGTNYGITLCNYSKVINNQFTISPNAATDSMVINAYDNCIIRGNQIFYTPGWGFYAFQNDVILDGNTINNAGPYAIYNGTAAYRTIVTNNNINTGSGYGIVLRTSGNIITNNIVKNTTNYGIYVDTSYGYNVITNNNSQSYYIGDKITNCVDNNIGYINKNGGWATVADAGTITHGLSSTPNKICVTPSGSIPIMYSCKGGSSTITVYHSAPDSRDFSWYAEV